MPVAGAQDYRKYLEAGEEAADLLAENETRETGGFLNTEQQTTLEIQTRRAATLEKVYNARGFRFAVTNDNGGGVLAFVPLASGDPHFVEATLDRPIAEIMEIAGHEITHIQNIRAGKKEIDLKENLGNDHRRKVLNEAVADLLGKGGCNDLADVNLIEGITQYRTLECEGQHCDCAYNHFEVPIVQRLEKLSREKLGISLVGAYKQSLPYFYEQLRKLADTLIAEKLYAFLKSNIQVQKAA